MRLFEKKERCRRRGDINLEEVARQLSNHIESCSTRNAEMTAQLLKQSDDRLAMHKENSLRFSKLERAQYLAMGGAAVIFWILTRVAESIRLP